MPYRLSEEQIPCVTFALGRPGGVPHSPTGTARFKPGKLGDPRDTVSTRTESPSYGSRVRKASEAAKLDLKGNHKDEDLEDDARL